MYFSGYCRPIGLPNPVNTYSLGRIFQNSGVSGAEDSVVLFSGKQKKLTTYSEETMKILELWNKSAKNKGNLFRDFLESVNFSEQVRERLIQELNRISQKYINKCYALDSIQLISPARKNLNPITLDLQNKKQSWSAILYQFNPNQFFQIGFNKAPLFIHNPIIEIAYHPKEKWIVIRENAPVTTDNVIDYSNQNFYIYKGEDFIQLEESSRLIFKGKDICREGSVSINRYPLGSSQQNQYTQYTIKAVHKKAERPSWGSVSQAYQKLLGYVVSPEGPGYWNQHINESVNKSCYKGLTLSKNKRQYDTKWLWSEKPALRDYIAERLQIKFQNEASEGVDLPEQDEAK